MITRNGRTRRGTHNRLLSMLPAAAALSLFVASGTALADGPLDAVQQPVAAATQPVTQAVQTVTASAPAPAAPASTTPNPVTTTTQSVTQATQPVTQAVTQATNTVAQPVTQTVTQATNTVAQPVTQTVTQATNTVAKPVTQAVTKATNAVTQAATQTTNAVTKPVTQAVSQTTSAVTKPVTQTTNSVTNSVTSAAQPLTAAAKHVATTQTARLPAKTAVTKAVTAQTRQSNGTGGATTSARTQAKPAQGQAASGAAGRAASSTRVVGGSTGDAAPRARAGAAAVVAGVNLLADRVAIRAGDGSSSTTRQVEAAPRASVAGGSSNDGVPGGAIGLAALLGLLGLGVARSGQVASGFLAIHGTGGMRAASQSLLTFAWSGRCRPVGDGSANAVVADGAVGSSRAGAEGGRGAAKGVLDPETADMGRGDGSLPPALALIAAPRGSGGLPALLWGLLVGSSALVGALLGRFTSAGRRTADDAS